MIQADTAGGMRQHLAWSGLGFRVLVREEDVAMARDVLKPPPDTDHVVVQTFATQDEADCALGELLSAGIAATIMRRVSQRRVNPVAKQVLRQTENQIELSEPGMSREVLPVIWISGRFHLLPFAGLSGTQLLDS